MLRRTGMCLLVMALVLFAMSCTKLSEFTTEEEGGIAIEKLGDIMTSIPLKFGKLISVSFVTERNLSQLWFQDDDGNVRMVVFNMNTNRLWAHAWLFPQK